MTYLIVRGELNEDGRPIWIDPQYLVPWQWLAAIIANAMAARYRRRVDLPTGAFAGWMTPRALSLWQDARARELGV